MSIDFYGTRTMLRALEERRAPKQFFRDRFFQAVEASTTQTIEMDIYRNKRRLAPFVHPLAEGKLVERIPFRAISIKPPYIKEKMPATAVDMQGRQFGETVYSQTTPEQRIANQTARDLAELQDMIDRRIEWMCASALFNDSITVTGEGLNAVIDFGRAGSNDVTLTSADRWDQAGATPVHDLRAWKRIVAQATGLVPDVAVIGTDAADALISHQEIIDIIDRPVQSQITISMDTSDLENGVTYVGRIEGIDIWTYEEWYLDDNGVEQPLVPVDKFLLASSRARREVHFGAILDLDAGGIAAVPYWPKSWRVPDPSVQWIMLQSAPLPVPHQVDAALVADVI